MQCRVTPRPGLHRECSCGPHVGSRKWRVFTLPLRALVPFACIASVHAASLSQLAADALAHDATFISAAATYRAGLEKQPEARAALLPHLALTQSDFRNAIHVPGRPAAPYSTLGATLSFNQSLFKWDDWQSYQQSKLLVVGAGLTFADAKQELLLRVAQGYFDALAAKDTFLLAQEHLRSVDEQLALTQRSFTLGAATVVDRDEAQAASDSAHADLVKAQSELARRHAALQKIVGHPVDALDALDSDLNVTTIASGSSDAWETDASTSGLDVRQQQIALEVAKREVRRVDADYLPSVSIVGNASHGNAAFINGQTNFYTGANRASSGEIGIQISIPLFDGFSTSSKKREALALVDKAESDLESARRSATLEAQQAFLAVRDGLAQINALRTAQRSAETALQSDRKGFRVGVRINADVLDATDKLFRTRIDLAKARYDTLMQFLHLKASVAQLDESTLAEPGASDASQTEPLLR